MIYIGHLDLLKFFQRIIKRAKLPIGYSWGYNPHQLITFALPLPLGMSGLGEIADIQLTRRVECDEIKNMLNSVLPSGISILKASEMDFHDTGCAAAVAWADYSISLNKKFDDIRSTVDSIMEKEEINIEKVGKKKTRTVDIRSLIRYISVDNGGDVTVLNCNIAAGSQGNLKPDVLLKYIYSSMDEEFDITKTDIVRKTLYTQEKGVLVPLCQEERSI